MARVQISDEVWASFRAALGVTPVNVALGELVEREVGRQRRRSADDVEGARLALEDARLTAKELERLAMRLERVAANEGVPQRPLERVGARQLDLGAEPAERLRKSAAIDAEPLAHARHSARPTSGRDTAEGASLVSNDGEATNLGLGENEGVRLVPDSWAGKLSEELASTPLNLLGRLDNELFELADPSGNLVVLGAKLAVDLTRNTDPAVCDGFLDKRPNAGERVGRQVVAPTVDVHARIADEHRYAISARRCRRSRRVSKLLTLTFPSRLEAEG